MPELLLYKICITMLAVLGLSFVAEKISTRLAGLLAGYPIGTAIILHFYGLEFGAEFAANAAIYNLCGLFASQCFAYAYYRSSRRWPAPLPCTLLALVAYFVPAVLVSQAQPTRVSALALALLATGLFCILLRGRKEEQVLIDQAWSTRLVAGRLLLTASLVLLVTGVAGIVGPGWAGLFSAFPVALYPLVLLLHRSHGEPAARTVLGNFPYGLWSVIAYALTVSLVYPAYGVIAGTLIGFAIATVVLLPMVFAPLVTGRGVLEEKLNP